MDDGKELTEKELRFCQEYAADPNATQAYRRAFPGVTYKTARTEGGRLLANPDIQAELEAARKEYRRRCRVTALRVLMELAGIAHADPADLFAEDPDTGLPRLRRWSEIDPAARRTIQTIEITRRRLRGGGGKDDVTEWEIENVKVKQHAKDAAIDKLCKHLGLTNDGEALRELIAALAKGEGDAANP